MEHQNILSALAQNRGLNRDLNPGPLAPKARIIPLDHWAQLCPDWHWQVGDIDQHSCSQGHAMIQNFICAQASLYSSVAERWSCKPKVMSSILIGGTNNFAFLGWPIFISQLKAMCSNKESINYNGEQKIILTPTWFEHAAFWSGVRRATVAPRSHDVRKWKNYDRFYRDLNSDRWIQSPEC